jgi:outer membrane protease
MDKKLNFYDTKVNCVNCGYELVRREVFIGLNLSYRLNDFLCGKCVIVAQKIKSHWFNSYQENKIRKYKRELKNPR